MPKVEFHSHTRYSDGTLTPLELRALLRDIGVIHFSVTDHDEIGANKELLAVDHDVMHFVTGVELTTHYKQKTLHLLAYGFDPENQELADFLMRQRLARRKRAEEIVALLNHDIIKEGLSPIPIEDILALEVEGPITRPDIARYLIKIGYVKVFREAFERWLRNYNIPLDTSDIYETIDLIRGVGGLPVLAHAFAPYISVRTLGFNLNEQVQFLANLRRKGLSGVEIFGADYCMYTHEIPLSLAIAEQVGLIVTGDSDFHGGGKSSTTLPGVELPRVYLEKFLEKLS